jgi:hypothetical protein
MLDEVARRRHDSTNPETAAGDRNRDAAEASGPESPPFEFDPWGEPLRASRLGHALALHEIQLLRAQLEVLESLLQELITSRHS